MCLLILERQKKGETVRNIDSREISIGCFLYTHWPGTGPTTLACALTENRTHKLPVYGMMLQPTELPGQGYRNLEMGHWKAWCQFKPRWSVS